MKTRRNLVQLAALSGALATVVPNARAHILLDAPMRRADDTNDIKTAPCGPRDGSTRSTDPGRVTTYAPGETITVEWHETIHHPGHYRIAFDDDGQDSFVDKTGPLDIVDPPVLPVLLDGIPDTSGAPDTFSVEVTLPDIECDNCTLQVIQYMTDRNEPYYQCADLVLQGEPGGSGGSPAGGAGNDGAGGVSEGGTGSLSGGGGMEPDTGGAPPLAPSGGAPATGGAPSSGGTSGGVGGLAASSGGSGGGTQAGSGGVVGVGVGGTGGMTMQDWMNGAGGEGEGQGCGVGTPGASTRAPWWMLVALIPLLGLRRRAVRRS